MRQHAPGGVMPARDAIEVITEAPARLGTFRCAVCGLLQRQPNDLPAEATCDRCDAPLRPTGRVRFAPMRLRAVAGVIDVFAMFAPYLLLSLAFFIASPSFPRNDNDELTSRTVIVLRTITVVVMFTWLWAQESLGVSCGKALLGIRAVDTRSWTRPGPIAGLIRLITKLLSIAALGLGYLGMLSDHQRRALPDWVADTYVVER